METTLRVLHLEDEPADTELVRQLLQRDGLAVQIDRVATLDGFRQALGQGYQLILSDYTIPGLNTLETLRLARQERPELPFIFVSGTLGEELAIETLKLGATDYVLKQRMTRLAPAVRRALKETEERTGRKSVEDALHESEARFRGTFENAAVGISHMDRDGRWLEVNQKLCEILGYSREELLQQNFLFITHPDEREAEAEQYSRLMRGEIEHYSTEKRFVRRDGQEAWLHVTRSLQRDETGQPRYSISVVQDISDRKRTEAALRESEERERLRAGELEAVLQAVPAAVWIAQDPDCRQIRGNRAADELLRLPRGAEASLTAPEETRPTHFKVVKDGRELTGDALPVQAAARGATVRDFEYDIVFADGTVRHMLGNATPLLDEQGRPRGAVGAIVEISERKRAEEQLRRQAQMLDLAPVMVRSLDQEIVHWSQGMEKLYGWPAEEALGKTCHELLQTQFPQPLEEIMATLNATGRWEGELRHIHRDGAPLQAASLWTLYHDAQGAAAAIIEVDHDITAIKRAEAALRQSEQRLRATFDNAALGIVETDDAGRFIAVNHRLCQILDYRREELLRLSVHELTDPEDRPRSDELNAALREGRTNLFDYEKRYLRRDGSPLWVHVTVSPVRDESGRLLHSIGTVEDISARKRAEAEIALLARIPGENPNPVMRLDLDHRLIYGNDASRLLLKSWDCQVGQPAPEAARAAAQTAWTRGESVELELTVNDRTYSLIFTPIADQGYVNVYGRDITERKRAEAALEAERARLQAVLDSLPVAVWIADAQGMVIQTSKAVEQVWGPAPLPYGIDEYAEYKGWWAETGERLQGRDWALARAVMKGEVSTGEVIDIERFNGTRATILNTASPVRDSKGRITGAVAVAQDITELRRSEHALRQSELFYRQTLESIPGMVFTTRPDGYCDYQSQQWVEYTGVPMDEHIGGGWNKLLHPEDQPRAWAAWLAAVEGRAPYDLEYRVRRRDGQYEWFKVIGRPIRDAAGQIVRWFGVATNIDGLKRVEAELRTLAAGLRQSEEKFRSFFERASIGMGRVGFTDARWIDVNDTFCRMLGYSREEMRATPWPQITHPEDVNLDLIPFRRMAAGDLDSYVVEKRFIHQEGRHVWARLNLSLVRDAQGRPDYEIAVIEDIGERKRAEEALRQSEAHLHRVLDSLFAFIGVMTPDGVLTYINRSTLEVSRLRPEEVLGKPLAEARWWSHSPEVKAQIMEAVVRGREGATVRFDASALVADERRIIIDFALTPMRDEQGRITHLIPSAVDITERKRAEEALRESEERLRQSEETLRAANQRLAEADRRKDEFLAMLAHELRNPLAPIRYAVQMLNLAGSPQPQMQKQREVIDRQVSHMGRLLDDLLDISRVTRGKITLRRETVDLRAVAAQALDSLRPMIEGREQHLRYEEPSAPLLVDGDPTRLEQIIRNLLHNANKYTETGGCITLSLGLEPEPEWRAVVRISDSGIGIAPEVLPHVFEAFVQAEQGLARSQGGLGIGLAMVRNLVQLHGGSVHAHSAGPGRGSEFVVRLPLAGHSVMRPKATGPSEAAQNSQTGPCRVLVVDDNEDSAASLSELLRLWGHQVQTAYDGPHALAAAREWRPEVILLDIGLPGIDGYRVAEHLRREPATRHAYVVALTGYGAEEDRRRAQEAGFDHHLTKPVEMEQLQMILKRPYTA